MNTYEPYTLFHICELKIAFYYYANYRESHFRKRGGVFVTKKVSNLHNINMLNWICYEWKRMDKVRQERLTR